MDLMREMVENSKALLADNKSIIDWFDPTIKEHREAFAILQESNQWPKGFIPENLDYPQGWVESVKIKFLESKINEAPEDLKPDAAPLEDDELLDDEAPEEETPEEELEPEAGVDFEKLYLGRQKDTHFYIVAENNDQGVLEDLKVVDQEGNEVYAAVQNELDPKDVSGFIQAVLSNVDIAQIERSVVMQYLVPQAEEEIELEDEEGEEEEELETDLESPEEEMPEVDKVKPVESKVRKIKEEAEEFQLYLQQHGSAKKNIKTFSSVEEATSFAIKQEKMLSQHLNYGKPRTKDLYFNESDVPMLKNLNTGEEYEWTEDQKFVLYKETSERKIKEAKQGVDYVKRVKAGVKKATVALKDKDSEAAAKALTAVSDDAADAAKALGKMKQEADEQAAIDKEKEVSEDVPEDNTDEILEEDTVDEKTAPTCVKCKKAHWPFQGCGGKKEVDKETVECNKSKSSKSVSKMSKKKVKEAELDETTITDEKGNSFSVNLIDESDEDITIQINQREFHFQPDFALMFGEEKADKITDEAIKKLALETIKHLDESDYAELIGSGKVEESKVNEGDIVKDVKSLVDRAKQALSDGQFQEAMDLTSKLAAIRNDVPETANEVIPEDEIPVEDEDEDAGDWTEKNESKVNELRRDTSAVTAVADYGNESKIKEGMETIYNGKHYKVTKIEEANVTLTVTDEAGASMNLTVNGEAALNVNPDGVITIDPASTTPVGLEEEPMLVDEEPPMVDEEPELPAEEELEAPAEEETEKKKLPWESKTNECGEFKVGSRVKYKGEKLHGMEEPSPSWAKKYVGKIGKIVADLTPSEPQGSKSYSIKFEDGKRLPVVDDEIELLESKTNEGDGDLAGSTKEVYEVEYDTKSGEHKKTRVTGENENDAKKYLQRKKSVAKITKVKKISKANEQKTIEVPTKKSAPVQKSTKQVVEKKVAPVVETLTQKKLKEDKLAFGGSNVVKIVEMLLGLEEEDTYDETIQVGDTVQIVQNKDLKPVVSEAVVKAIDEVKGCEITGNTVIADQQWYGADFYQVFKV